MLKTNDLVAAPLAIGAQGVRMRHGDDIIAGIDEVNFAGHAGRKVGEKIEPGAAEVVERGERRAGIDQCADLDQALQYFSADAKSQIACDPRADGAHEGANIII